MSPTQAILAGAALIAGTILFVEGVHPVQAAIGQFVLVHHSNVTANAGVFRMDIATGDVSYCFLPPSNNVEVVCTKPTH